MSYTIIIPEKQYDGSCTIKYWHGISYFKSYSKALETAKRLAKLMAKDTGKTVTIKDYNVR